VSDDESGPQQGAEQLARAVVTALDRTGESLRREIRRRQRWPCRVLGRSGNGGWYATR